MAQNVFRIFKAIATVLGAVVLLVFPAQLAALAAVDLTDGGVLIARLLGATYLIFGIMMFGAVTAELFEPRAAYLFGLQDLLAAGLVIAATLAGVMNGYGWVSAAIYGGFGLGFIVLAKRT